MTSSRWIKLDELRQPGMRRVLDGLSRVRDEMHEPESDKPSVPPAHLLRETADHGRVGHGG